MLDPQKDIEQQVIAKATEDQAFKQSLLNNPKATLEAELGQKFPEATEIEVVQQTPHKLYIVLPLEIDQLAQSQTQELSEQELEAVSGGSTPILTIVATATLCSETWPC